MTNQCFGAPFPEPDGGAGLRPELEAAGRAFLGAEEGLTEVLLPLGAGRDGATVFFCPLCLAGAAFGRGDFGGSSTGPLGFEGIEGAL